MRRLIGALCFKIKMEVKTTNFDGSWDDVCEYCGRSQKSHQVDAGKSEGIQYLHRMPCEEEQYEINKKAVKRGINIRTIIWFYDLAKYIWDKIPFKKETRLLYDFSKNIFISIRALIFLHRSKPK